jgi:hypothetical protein
MSSDLISARRESVLTSFEAAEKENRLRFLEGDDKATSEYIYENQRIDALFIVNAFYHRNRRVVSIQKKTKVGADGLMLQIAKLMTTHIDNEFVVNPNNVRILTGMSNAGWEKDMIEKAPNCLKNKIFHHGKLSRAELMNMQNGLIIVDEIDTGDKEEQVLHNTLKEAEVLDVEHMVRQNNRFVFISATMIRELYDLYRWGDYHEVYKMTIPRSYIGHKDFLQNGILQEFCDLSSTEEAERWIQEDIIDYYGNDYRVHIVRVNIKTVKVIENACIRKRIRFRNHTSTDRLTNAEIKEFFKEPLNNHIVLGVKGFFRRANLIPNRWKLRIGAMHELYTETVDNNVQIQGLVGRMTGYWREIIESGHKTGPYRTSIQAVEEYENTYNDPFGLNSYQTNGFKKDNGRVSSQQKTLLTAELVNLQNPKPTPRVRDPKEPKNVPIVFKTTPEEYRSIKKSGGSWDYETIRPLIQKYSPDTLPQIDQIYQNGGKDLITEPDSPTTYHDLIQRFVNANDSDEVCYHTGNITDERIDKFSIYLDKKDQRLIVSIYNGSRKD